MFLYFKFHVLPRISSPISVASNTKRNPFSKKQKKLKETDCKMVLCVRTDLGMTKGKVAAQCCHAALAAYQDALDEAPEYLDMWETRGQAKITLKVQSEEELLQLYKKARKAGLVACVVQDAGRTQIASGSRTVLAVGPGEIVLWDCYRGFHCYFKMASTSTLSFYRYI